MANANAGALTLLRNSWLFKDLDASIIARLGELCATRQYAKGEVVFVQGENGDALYGVVAGEIRVSANSAQGQEMHLNVIQPGEILGEIALLDGGARSASAIATKASMLLVMPRDAFLKLMQQEHSLASHFMVLLCQRIRWISEIVEDEAFRSVPMRLARRVAILARLHGEETEEGTILRLSQHDLAQFLNVSRQVVNVNLQQWQRDGLVSLSRGAVVVKDFEGLDYASVANT